MSEQNKPSEGAMRAARALIDILAPGDHERNVLMAADLIDSETGLPDLLAACEAQDRLIRYYGILLANYRTHSRPGEMTLDEVNKAAAVTDAARAAIAKTKATSKPAEAHGAD